MFDVLLCHSSSDTQLAKTIAERLRCASEAEVWLQPCPSPVGKTVVEAWECGLSSRAIVLLLSPDAVPRRVKREEWDALLQHVEQESLPPVVTLLTANCPYPKLIERKHFYRYCDDPQGTLRAMSSWLLENHLGGLAPRCVPADLPWCTGREQELSLLWDVLVDGAGTVAISNPNAAGKTCLAQKFARAASPHFRDILWLDCTDRSASAIAGELASQSGISAEGSLEQVLARLESVFEDHRLLVVLDNLAAPFPLAPHTSRTRTSLLITTRDPESCWPSSVQVLQIDDTEIPGLSAATMSAAQERLWQAMSICRHSGFSLAFAAAIAEMEEPEARAVCDRLVEARYVDPFEPIRGWLRTTTAKERTSETGQLHRKHAEVLAAAFKEWWKRPDPCANLVGEVAPAFHWAVAADWELAAALGERAFSYLKSKGRWLEAVELCQELAEAARKRGDTRLAESCIWELSWIQDEQGVIRQQSVSAEQLAFDFRPAQRAPQLI